MREGWCNDDYWVLCEDQKEAEHITGIYGLADYLPGYSIVGLKWWDDFILVDPQSQCFLVPTLPLDRHHLAPFDLPAETLRLQSDERFTKKIRWFVKPIRFGGDPSAAENVAWLSLQEHAMVVKWWNKLYFDIHKKQQQS